ncbi:MAG: SpoIID/LytB domain-containing protein, partial [Actinomycetota bacterium]
MPHPKARSTKILIAALTWAGLTIPSPAHAATPLPANAPLVTDGHGWGHGRGLGQWGAKGQADAGKTWSQIVLSYYKGVTIGTRSADEDIRVLLATSADVLVSSDATFSVKWIGQGTLASSDTTYRFFRARHDGANYIVEKASAHTGPWILVGKNTIAARFVPGSAYLQHIEDSGVVRYYRGTIDATRTGATSMRSINELTMRHYLYGAVPREMPATWAVEAVRAQALAARSYATYKKDAARASDHAFDICATTSCQVYLGVASRGSVGSSTVVQLEHPASSAAVDAVAGKVLLYGGKPILAEYSSSTGGYTAAGSVPYLSPVPDPSDAISPHHDWSTEISADAVEATWPEIGQLVGVTVTERNGLGEWGGRVLKMQLVGTTKTLTISGDTFRSAFSSQGVKSNWFRIATFQGALAATPPKIPVVSGSFAILQILMKNTGTASWPVGGAVRLGTPDASRFSGAGWISSTRAAAVTANVTVPGKTSISPGHIARFDVRLNAALVPPRSHAQTFQLMNDDLGIVMSPAFSTTLAVVRPNIGVVRGNIWYVRASSYDTTFAYGKSSDRPVVGDWDGDGTQTPGLVRGNIWYLNNGFDGFSEVPPFAYGNPTDRVLVGDWNGDGVDTPAVIRGNLWYVNNGFDGSHDVPRFAFGSSTDIPIAGDWDGDGKDTPGLVRANRWYLNEGYDGIAETNF